MITKLDTLTHPSAGSFQVGQADEHEAEVVRSLLVEAAEWMRVNGIQQWHPEQFTVQEIRNYFAQREVYLLMYKLEPVGMLTLQTSDPEYWGPLNEEGYSYLHRLVVSPKFRRYGLGRELIYWAAKHSRQLGRRGLRFDCWSENSKLNPYYVNLGMIQQGIGTRNDRNYTLYEMDMNLYQKI